MRPTSVPLLLVAIAVGGAAAWAEDPLEKVRIEDAQSLLARIGTLHEAKDRAALEAELPGLVRLHNELLHTGMRSKLQAAAGDLVGDEELGALRLLAVDALAQLKDPDGAWKQLRPHVPAPADETVPQLGLRVLDAVGRLAPHAAIPSLVALMEKGKDLNAARYAAAALGGYGWSKKRAKVLGELGTQLRRLRPGGLEASPDGRGAGQALRERYDALGATILDALNRLTGQRIDGPDQWLEALEKAEKDPESLFRNRRP